MLPYILRRNGKKLMWFGFLLMFMLIVTKPKTRKQIHYAVFIPNRHARAVWDYMADLNHMKVTNPGLKKFSITFDGGKYPEWHYGAMLIEDIKTIGRVDIEAEYIVKPWGQDYVIESIYKWCKILMCVHVNSTTTFRNAANDQTTGTTVSEVLQLQMPTLLSWHIGSTVEELHKNRLDVIQHQLEGVKPM